MKKVIILLLSAILLQPQMLFAQHEPEISVTLLANDKIADVNLDEKENLEDIKSVLDLVKTSFADIKDDQKVAVLLNIHKTGSPTFEVFARPALSAERKNAFLTKARSMKIRPTKLVDFPIVFDINAKGDLSGFEKTISPIVSNHDAYEASSMGRKLELNKAWAVSEVLPVLAAYELKAEAKFEGVNNFGKLVATTDFSKSQNCHKLTSENPDYWRAVMEMGQGNQLIPTTKIFMLVSQGRLDEAREYLKIVQLFSNEKTIPDKYLDELEERLEPFYSTMNSRVNMGIAEHDKGNFEKAISVYEEVLKEYPNSAWARYELYFSQHGQEVEDKKVQATDMSLWNKSKASVYASDPLYPLAVNASNRKEGFLLYRRREISELFKEKDSLLVDVYKYADIALDLGEYGFAAQVYWLAMTVHDDTYKMLNKFLYCMEKLGIPGLKKNFKGDFKKEFAAIDDEIDQRMKSNTLYQSMKD